MEAHCKNLKNLLKKKYRTLEFSIITRQRLKSICSQMYRLAYHIVNKANINEYLEKLENLIQSPQSTTEESYSTKLNSIEDYFIETMSLGIVPNSCFSDFLAIARIQAKFPCLDYILPNFIGLCIRREISQNYLQFNDFLNVFENILTSCQTSKSFFIKQVIKKATCEQFLTEDRLCLANLTLLPKVLRLF